MSYETDRLQQEINSIKWQKAEAWQLSDAVSKIIRLTEQLAQTVNNFSYAEERIWKLEQEVNELKNLTNPL
jgi:chromosome segregation ATPase